MVGLSQARSTEVTTSTRDARRELGTAWSDRKERARRPRGHETAQSSAQPTKKRGRTSVDCIYIILFHCVKYPLGACGIGGRMSRNAVHKPLKGMEAPAGSVPRELIGAGGLPPAGAYNSRRRRGVAVFLSIKTLPPLPSRFGAKNVEVCEPVYYVHQSTTAAITARRPNLWPPQFTNQPSTLV